LGIKRLQDVTKRLQNLTKRLQKGAYDADDGGIEMDIAEATEFGGFTDEEFGIG
jgi:hypothetical protein